MLFAMKKLSLLLALFVFALDVNGQVCLRVDPTRCTNAKQGVFHHVSEALRYAESLNNDTVWTEIHIQPSVYWMDDPDDPEVRRPANGQNTPFAMEVRLNHVRLIGECKTPEDVVLACNRGQTQGAEGNFTMLHIIGNDVEAKNITFGNYCNVDLVYPRNPALNRTKRKDAIVQAQLVICEGDRYKLNNCRFISRLNLCPFVGGRTVDFDNCYFECTDDALCGTGTYRNCRFTFYSGKPFYSTYGSGAAFYDCVIHSKVHGIQYLTKMSGPVTMERCQWTSEDPELKIEWNKRPDPRHYCVMRNCTLNGNPLDVPTPTDPLPVVLPPLGLAVQPEVVPGRWTIDCYKPSDTYAYNWQPDNTRSAWGYAEGMDGAEGQWGLVQLQRGARLMFTAPDDNVNSNSDTNSNINLKQYCVVTLDPCKGPGQGFGSATGQYLDLCIKFDTKTLTGYGLRFIRTPEYDKAVEIYLVEYEQGQITRISEPQRCDLFRKGCKVVLSTTGTTFAAEISNENLPDMGTQSMSVEMKHPTGYRGFHLQHTGSTGASATVIKSIFLK